MADRLQFTLLENAADYVLSAAENARGDSPRRLKYALLHLVAAIELLLKARLLKEHWSLLFADVDRASQTALATGNFRSVGFESTYERLEGTVGLQISAEARAFLDSLRRLRNQIQHFAIDVELDAVRSVVSRGLNFFIEFSMRELPFDGVVDADIVTALYEHLRELDTFVTERLGMISADLQHAEAVGCSRCWQDSMVIGEEQPHCLFCGLVVDAEDLANEISEGGVEACPECGHETCAFVLYNNDAGGWVCTSCGVRSNS